jgi:hypothetical protein
VIEYQLRTFGESPDSVAGEMWKVALAYNGSLRQTGHKHKPQPIAGTIMNDIARLRNNQHPKTQTASARDRARKAFWISLPD